MTRGFASAALDVADLRVLTPNGALGWEGLAAVNPHMATRLCQAHAASALCIDGWNRVWAYDEDAGRMKRRPSLDVLHHLVGQGLHAEPVEQYLLKWATHTPESA